MKEYINCDSCHAPFELYSDKCDYCGNDYFSNATSSELVLFIREIDKEMIKSNIGDLLLKINKSKFKNHPTILYRKAKTLLIEYMSNDKILDANEFCEIVKIINDISKISGDYWMQFLIYLNVLLPNKTTKLFKNDYKQILTFLKSIQGYPERLIENKLVEQLIVSEFGYSFLMEYNFYTDKNNFIENYDFNKKKELLMKKYSSLLSSIDES